MEKNALRKIKFKFIIEEWLQYKKTTIKESSYFNYKFIIEANIKKEMGEKNLEELLQYNFNSFVEQLMEKLSSKTVKDIMTVLKAILKYAEIKYDINFKISLISTPAQITNEVEVFNDRDRKKMEKYCIESKEIRDLGVLISLYTGLRIGEVCALKWSDIDFEKKYIKVNHTLQRVYVNKRETKVLYDRPKTKKSIRKIPMAKVLYEKLKEISKNYDNEAFVLTGSTKRYYEPLGYRYIYRKILEKCDIEYKRYHQLRHTFATRCIKVGMDVKSLSEVLGHANVSITLNIYVHSSFETKNKFINKL
jgi:integrase